MPRKSKSTTKPPPTVTLKPGDKVYRVVEVDTGPDDNTLHTWKVIDAVVKTASDRQIAFDTYTPGLWNKRFPPSALGSLFHATPEAAVLHFLRVTRRDVETAERAIKTAQRAIAWVHLLYPDLMEAPRGEG